MRATPARQEGRQPQRVSRLDSHAAASLASQDIFHKYGRIVDMVHPFPPARHTCTDTNYLRHAPKHVGLFDTNYLRHAPK